MYKQDMKVERMYNVLIVEDNPIEKRFLQECINSKENYNLVGIIGNAANAEIICLKIKVDLIIMDICTDDGESGLVAAKKLKDIYPKLKIIITSLPEYNFINKSRKIKCDSFWYKSDDVLEFYEILDRTIRGENVYPKCMPIVRIGLTTSQKFTDRELKIMTLIVKGYKQEEIGSRLNISYNTVKTHIKHIFEKTGFNSSTELVVELVQKGFIVPYY